MGNGYCLTDTVISANGIKIIKKLLNVFFFFFFNLKGRLFGCWGFPSFDAQGSSDKFLRQIFYPAKPELWLFIPVGQCSYVLGVFCLLPVRVCEQNLHLWEPHCGEHAVVFSFWLMVLVLHHLASDRLH